MVAMDRAPITKISVSFSGMNLQVVWICKVPLPLSGGEKVIIIKIFRVLVADRLNSVACQLELNGIKRPTQTNPKRSKPEL